MAGGDESPGEHFHSRKPAITGMLTRVVLLFVAVVCAQIAYRTFSEEAYFLSAQAGLVCLLAVFGWWVFSRD